MREAVRALLGDERRVVGVVDLRVGGPADLRELAVEELAVLAAGLDAEAAFAADLDRLLQRALELELRRPGGGVQARAHAEVQLRVVGQQRLGAGDRGVAELEARASGADRHRVLFGVFQDCVEGQDLRTGDDWFGDRLRRLRRWREQRRGRVGGLGARGGGRGSGRGGERCCGHGRDQREQRRGPDESCAAWHANRSADGFVARCQARGLLHAGSEVAKDLVQLESFDTVCALWGRAKP
ncbi:hypothetical protein OV079_35265 [Nannocystis pusilla]|uniref:Uncharacterized protein n=1 Tax=Nannocystis pusilla TaxID=889268 RepID=A0A9X3J153_9BACT|nr:hypothetical protein [Nannocystis pusilla]MCY1010735.1 hypothetical protein [Nannocystis pusilla]